MAWWPLELFAGLPIGIQGATLFLNGKESNWIQERYAMAIVECVELCDLKIQLGYHGTLHAYVSELGSHSPLVALILYCIVIYCVLLTYVFSYLIITIQQL